MRLGAASSTSSREESGHVWCSERRERPLRNEPPPGAPLPRARVRLIGTTEIGRGAKEVRLGNREFRLVEIATIGLMSRHTGVILAEVGFLLILFAGVWLVAAQIPAFKMPTMRNIVAGIALALAGLLLIIATHWGHFGGPS